ncbi:hypothetical protein LTR10_009535 [Elasticomyces elasticus]|uniref:Uncharacterized protein n=1 Tax=Elasticomyces elasticus TaxID=574655 RepID=A0AAN7W7A4_9PEZI|nr:hypothetical protein LTR10_009535 [Elasticomyces elasticus]KAK4971369.1 hypothetical protein LTR42_007096 [Elasticomyces elasticus]KAK5695469.1 hypothetical protein LTR97_008977 [Elasticomyces elasticus]
MTRRLVAQSGATTTEILPTPENGSRPGHQDSIVNSARLAKQLMCTFNTAYVLAFLLMTAVLKINSTNLGIEIDFLQAMVAVIMVAACLDLPHYIAVMSVEVEYGLGFGGLYGSRT